MVLHGSIYFHMLMTRTRRVCVIEWVALYGSTQQLPLCRAATWPVALLCWQSRGSCRLVHQTYRYTSVCKYNHTCIHVAVVPSWPNKNINLVRENNTRCTRAQSLGLACPLDQHCQWPPTQCSGIFPNTQIHSVYYTQIHTNTAHSMLRYSTLYTKTVHSQCLGQGIFFVKPA